MINRFQEFSMSIAAIYRHIQKIERAEMVKYGLKGSTAQDLTALRLHREGLTAAQLCEMCDKDKAAVSRALAELERRALVTREKANDTAYRALVRLTEEGSAAARFVCEKVRQAVDLAGRGLTDQDRQLFYTNLRRIAHNLHTISKSGLPDIHPPKSQNIKENFS